jgi:hypothetical protein
MRSLLVARICAIAVTAKVEACQKADGEYRHNGTSGFFCLPSLLQAGGIQVYAIENEKDWVQKIQ